MYPYAIFLFIAVVQTKIINKLNNTVVYTGDSTIFRCKSDIPQLHDNQIIFWQFSHLQHEKPINIKSDSNIFYSLKGNNSVLFIVNTTSSYAGSYYCNDEGYYQTSGELIVINKLPKIKYENNNLCVEAQYWGNKKPEVTLFTKDHNTERSIYMGILNKSSICIYYNLTDVNIKYELDFKQGDFKHWEGPHVFTSEEYTLDNTGSLIKVTQDTFNTGHIVIIVFLVLAVIAVIIIMLYSLRRLICGACCAVGACNVC